MAVSGDRFQQALRFKGVSPNLFRGIALDMYGRRGHWAAGGWVAEHLGVPVDQVRRALAEWSRRGILRDVPMPVGDGARKAYAPADRDALTWMGRVSLSGLIGQPVEDTARWGSDEWELMLALTARQAAMSAADYAQAISAPKNEVASLLALWAAVDVVEVLSSVRMPGKPVLYGYRCTPWGRRWMSEQIVLVDAARGLLTPLPQPA